MFKFVFDWVRWVRDFYGVKNITKKYTYQYPLQHENTEPSTKFNLTTIQYFPNDSGQNLTPREIFYNYTPEGFYQRIFMTEAIAKHYKSLKKHV